MTRRINEKRKAVVELRRKLHAEELILGSFVSLPSPGFIEALGYAGLDFVIIDAEHGPSGPETAESLLRAADAAGTVALVRVPAHRYDLVSRVLDSGAAGIMMPMVETVEQLDRTHEAMRFPPLGRRGLAPSVRAGGYGALAMADFVKWSNEETLLIAQFETGTAVDAAEALLAHKVIDLAFIGTADLSNSLGYPGNTSEPAVVAAVDRLIGAAKANGLPVGSIALTSQMAADWVRRDVNFVALSSTLGFKAYGNHLADTRNLLKDIGARGEH